MLLSAYLDLLLEKIQKLTAKKISVILILFFVIVVFTNGISIVPPQHYQRLSQNPFITRTDIAIHNYWQETILLPVIAFYTHLNSRVSYNVLCFFIIVSAYWLFAQLTHKCKGSVLALISTTILLTSPLNTMMLTWLGTPDSLTFALTIPFLFTNSSLLIFFLCMLGTMNHITLAIAASEILILRWMARDNIKGHHLVAVIIGGIAGYSFVQAFLAFNQIQVYSRLDFVLAKDLIAWVKLNFTNFPAAIFSLFNIQWLILLTCLIMFFKKDKPYYSSLLIILLFNYGITFFTVDTTRIFSLLSWGVLINCVFHSYELSVNSSAQENSSQKQFLQALIVIGLISFITPRYYAWKGHIYSAPFYALLTFLKSIFSI